MYDKRVYRSEGEAYTDEQREEREFFFREWCKFRGLDPEDTESMRGYEEWYAWEHGAVQQLNQPNQEEQP